MIDLSNYPSPVCVAFSEAEATENIQLRFRATLNAFAATLKYCALITINNYLDARKQDLFRSDEIDRHFVEMIGRPSMGHWNHLMRLILKEMGGKNRDLLFIPELFDFYFRINKAGNLKVQAEVPLIDHLILLRNQFVHSDIYPPDDEAARLAEESRKILIQVLSSLSFLTKYPLVRLLHREGREEVCSGLAQADPIEDQYITYYIKKDGTSSSTKLTLGSFLYSSVKNLDKTRYVLLYEGFIGQRIKYVLNNYYLIIEDVEGDEFNPVFEIRSVIDVLALASKQRFEKEKELSISKLRETIINGYVSWDVFRDLSVKISDLTYDRFIKEGKFSLDLYTERKKINDDVADFLASGKSGMVVVADSGLGKTNLFCRLKHRLHLESQSVFLLYGRDYDGRPIEEYIMSALQLNDPFFKHNFRGGFIDLLNLLKETEEIRNGDKKIIFLFDAINEYKNPETLLSNILDFIKLANFPWLKIIFSIRTFIWNSLYGGHLLTRELFFHTTDKFGESVPFTTLEKFSEEEVRTAFNLYKEHYKIVSSFDDLDLQSRKALSNPLLMRFAAEAYHEDVIPDRLFTSKIFDKYREERINERDGRVLEYLSEAMVLLKTEVIGFRQLFHEENASPEESPLNVPSQIGGDKEALSHKIVTHVFAEPVYETDIVSVCKNMHCRGFEKYHALGYFSILTADGVPSCPVCGKDLGTMRLDFRTPYIRLQSENILQEFKADGDDALRFTYDRFFEYFVGEYLEKYSFEKFSARKGGLLYDIVKGVVKEYIFWGAIRNVLVRCLKDERYTVDFWHDVASYTGPVAGDEFGQAVQEAYNEILAAAITDLYGEDPPKAMGILHHMISRENINVKTIKLALNCMISILAENRTLSIDTPELLVLKRGLSFPDNSSGMEAARIIAAQYDVNPRLVLDFFRHLSRNICDYISISKLPGLISSSRRSELKTTLENLLYMLLYTLGPHYSDEENKEAILRTCGAILNQKVIVLGKGQVISIISKLLAKAYWNKGYPCNYLEIHLSLNKEFTEACKFIGNLFIDAENKRLMEWKEQILEYSKINNGLISWYLYSLIPIYGYMENQRDEVLDFLEELYENGNHISKYIAQKALWILAEHTDIEGDKHIGMFEKYSLKLLRELGPYIEYHHSVDNDPVIEKYLNTCDDEGNSRKHWGKKVGDRFVMTYDSSLVNDLANYKIRHTDISRLDFILELLEERSPADADFLPYIVMTLGRAGSVQNPAPVLMTLQSILEKYTDSNQSFFFDGKERTMKEMVINTLLNIKAFYPLQVNYFIDSLEPALQHKFMEVKLAEVKNRTDQLFSYYGESIYQKTFLLEKDARNIFGKGIIKATHAKTAEGLFRSYVSEFWKWFDTIRRDL